MFGILSRLSVIILAASTAYSQAEIEDFEMEPWSNHEDLAGEFSSNDLYFSVPAGASLKAVTGPAALQPGYNPEAPATKFIIEPINNRYLSLNILAATDLFKMPNAKVKVEGYRAGQLIHSQVIGPLWDEANNRGVSFGLSGFNQVERIEIVSDVVDINDSDVFFFLESVEYDLSDNIVPTIDTADTLSMAMNGSKVISLQHLTVSDLDNIYPDDFQLSVLAGDNYQVNADAVEPDQGFTGVLSVPVQVNDGFDDSNVYIMNITVKAPVKPKVGSASLWLMFCLLLPFAGMRTLRNKAS